MTTPLLAVQPSWTNALKSVYPKFGVATIASNLNSIQYVYGFLGRWTAASHPPHKPFPELRVAHQILREKLILKFNIICIKDVFSNRCQMPNF
ncbi:hypothetical protein AVEN_94397-1 [Araneus ventricosus]|uniref:Uncharacterized protein n=1 Tax=Araneus ventricosus TaxID=182803 RepID=A0A4Y2HZR3_ARAVE|nr:hypothetical protein AVEN_94397-1 [Araneus ventricosus]